MISTVRKHPSYLASILGALALFTLSTTSVMVEARDTAALKALELQQAVDEAHKMFKDLKEGKNADYIPILATVDSELFGVVIVTKDGKVFEAGDTEYVFAIESTSKPFNLAMVMQESGPEAVMEKIGVEPTGMPFNSKLALELLKARSVNPLVNAGAIAQVSMVKAANEKERWNKVLTNLSDFAGSDLKLMDEVFTSEYESSWSNRAIANLLYNYDRLYSEPEEAMRVYTKLCSVGVTTRELGFMGATLANGGVNPKTGKRLLDGIGNSGAPTSKFLDNAIILIKRPTMNDAKTGEKRARKADEYGNRAVPANETEAKDGDGCGSAVFFNPDTLVIPGQGARPPFIGLAHELIHALHNALGTKKGSGDQEESYTVGLGQWAVADPNAITENRMRLDFDLPIRHRYE